MRFSLPGLALVCVSASFAQQTRPALTAADYAHAEKFMPYNTTPLVYGAGVRPNFVASGDRFWYRVTRESGEEFMLVDPAKGTRAPAFDHAKLAAGLAAASGSAVEAAKLPFETIDFAGDLQSVSFAASGKRWKCGLDNYKCSPDTSAPNSQRRGAGGGSRGGPARTDSPSPDGKRTAFIRNYNLWVRDIATGAETQ
ncbi:MAG: DPP IV N-terminal domain-containing protein, partial [Acidobacteriota bacterium]|nr:DPP IV N-terminal domain-containing protein [Acidobacteriota bacterium]